MSVVRRGFSELSDADVDDVVQNVWLQLCAHPAIDLDTPQGAAWARTVLLNQARDRRRQLRRERRRGDLVAQVPEDAAVVPDTLQCVLSTEATDELFAVIGRLTPRQREALMLHAYGEPYAEIAARLSLKTTRGVESLLRRAKAAAQQEALRRGLRSCTVLLGIIEHARRQGGPSAAAGRPARKLVAGTAVVVLTALVAIAPVPMPLASPIGAAIGTVRAPAVSTPVRHPVPPPPGPGSGPASAVAARPAGRLLERRPPRKVRARTCARTSVGDVDAEACAGVNDERPSGLIVYLPEPVAGLTGVDHLYAVPPREREVCQHAPAIPGRVECRPAPKEGPS